ncbi:hypothetical protein VCSRO136_2396 [Vibrio cholerae]|nr:hypothetical protein VCSRO136_2396 [Vibrio cholerae]
MWFRRYIYNTLTKAEIKRDYQYYGYVYGFIPIYADNNNTVMTTRNYVPFIILDVTRFFFRNLVRLGLVKPGYYIKKTKPISFSA